MRKQKPIAERKKGGRPSRKPEDERILLALYQEHTSRELGELYDVPAGTVRAWVSQARKGCVQGNE